jgi:hypothetical protein
MAADPLLRTIVFLMASLVAPAVRTSNMPCFLEFSITQSSMSTTAAIAARKTKHPLTLFNHRVPVFCTAQNCRIDCGPRSQIGHR